MSRERTIAAVLRDDVPEPEDRPGDGWPRAGRPVTLRAVAFGGEDAALVAAMAEGNRDALAELYDRYASHLLAVARQMLGDRSEAEDLVHDVFLEVWRQAAGYEPARGTVRSWLLVRLRARTLDRIRLRRLRAPTAPTETPIAPAVDPDGVTVVRALAALPEDQRRALELAYWRGLSAAEIAALGEAPLGTVKSRISTGMAKLRAALSDPSTAEGAT